MLTSCGKEMEYKEVTKTFLKKEMSASPKNNNYSWIYGKNAKYHFFELVRLPSKNKNGSILLIKKRYKIEKDKLHVKITYELPDTNGAYAAMLEDRIKIEW